MSCLHCQELLHGSVKQAQLSAKPVSLGEGRQLITEAITKGHIKPRRPGHHHSSPPASMPFNFHDHNLSP